MLVSEYKSAPQEVIDNLLSQFLINSWSYSKVQSFSRNEKAFEMNYIYGYTSKSSATTIAGQAYHAGLDAYFSAKKEGKVLDLVDLEQIAFNFIEEVEANYWKLQKTTPTIAEGKIKAIKTTTDLLKNFYYEKGIYEDEIEEIIEVEVYGDEFINVNGVDIPLPCHFKIDLVAKLKSGKVAIIDHKSKGIFTSEEEMKLAIGPQAITYVNGYESKTSLAIDEVWFVENKYSQNRDKSPQLNKFVVAIDADTRKLYEALLYEPLKRMVEAVNNPDYIYLINHSDNYIDMAELYDFWAKTQISEIEEFDINPDKLELLKKRQKKIKDASIVNINPNVIKRFKQSASEFIRYDLSNKDMTQEEKIEHVLRTFGTIVKVAHIFDGYSSNTFLLEVSAGVKVASIQSNRLDLANALNVSNVRISKDLVVYEGKSYLSMDVSKKRDRDLLFNKKDLVDMKIPIGKDNMENVVYWDLNNHATPHALVCGSTGSGKSVELKCIIEYAKLAGVEQVIVLDPKFEFCRMGLKGVGIYSEIDEIEQRLSLLVEEMNQRVKSGEDSKTLIIFDEFADAQSQAKKGKDLDVFESQQIGFYANGKPKFGRVRVGSEKSLEENLRILLQKGRSVGFRIVCATQRASTKVITGDAKANFPVQICFRVPKEIDSRVVLDEPGAESLSGMGDGLIKSPEYKETIRFQAYWKQ